MRVEGFVEHAGMAVQHEHVRVADVGIRPSIAIGWRALNGRGDRERGKSDITFTGVIDHGDRNQGGRARIDNDIRDAVVSSGY